MHCQNKLVGRLIYLLEYLFGRNIYYVVEQPASSCMFDHLKFSRTLKKHNAQSVQFDMGFYGGDSKKPTVLCGTR